MRHDSSIATAADYADALLTARRAKNALLFLILLMLLIQLAIFFTVKYSGFVIPHSTSSTQPAIDAKWHDWLHYLVGASGFLGVAFMVVLAMVLYVIVNIMLVGRLIGVARVTSAFCWSIFVLFLIFPWQAFLRDQAFTSREFIIPGILYTWDELMAKVTLGTRERDATPAGLIVHWARFAVLPAVAVILLLVIHAKSNRGMKQALGEETPGDISADPTRAI